MAVTVRKATVQDALEFGPNVRKADIQETLASTGMEPYVVLPMAIASGGDHLSLIGDHGEIFGMFGVTDHARQDGVGVVWMMLTDDIQKYKVPFLRHGPVWLEKLHRDHDIIGNYVDARNELHIKWLRYLGFKFLRLVPEHGPYGLPFYEIIHVRE